VTIHNSILFNRRRFLKSSALLGSAAALEAISIPISGAAAGFLQPAMTLSYWSSEGLVDATTLASGDASLASSGVRVTIENYSPPEGVSPLFRGFVAMFVVDTGSQSEPLPFYAWVPTNPVKRSSFFMPVSPANGISFLIATAEQRFSTESYYLTVESASPAAKLRTGLYVIAAGYRRPEHLAPRTESGLVRLADTNGQPPSFEHLLIDVARAE
jgi:hypothetical protein